MLYIIIIETLFITILYTAYKGEKKAADVYRDKFFKLKEKIIKFYNDVR